MRIHITTGLRARLLSGQPLLAAYLDCCSAAASGAATGHESAVPLRSIHGSRQSRNHLMPFATSADGTRVYYELEGEGPAVVLQHGTGGSGQSWRDRGLVEAMKDRFQLVLVDSRGHGQSDRPTDQAAYALPKRVEDLTAIMDHAGIDRAHFYGFSMGGWIGYGVLKYAPGRFHSAVIGGFGPIADPYFGNDPAELARGSVERRETVASDEYEVIHAVFRETAAFEGAEDAVRDRATPQDYVA